MFYLQKHYLQISFMCKIFIVCLLVVKISDLLILNFGPFPSWYCYCHSFLKSTFSVIVIIVIDVTMTARYCFIFFLKNPGSILHDFWALFLNLWIIGLSCITQFVFFFSSGRQPLQLYVCIGHVSPSDLELPYKVRWFLYSLTVISMLVNLLISVHIKIYKKKTEMLETNSFLHFAEKTLLGDAFVCLCVLAIFSGILFGTITINKLFPYEENNKLSYNIFWLQQILAPLGLGLIGVLLIIKKKNMRNIIWKEVLESIKNINVFQH